MLTAWWVRWIGWALCTPLAHSVGITTWYVCNASGSGTVKWTVANGTRRGYANGLPRFTVFDYCPFGKGGGYCGTYQLCPSGDFGVHGEACYPEGWGEIEHQGGTAWGKIATDAKDMCPGDWASRTCPYQESAQNTTHLECPGSNPKNYTMTADPLPVSEDVGPRAVAGSFCGVALDGVPLYDSFEAADKTLEDARVNQDLCDGHITPGFSSARYHYHRAPVCANEGNTNSFPTPYLEVQGQHSPQLAWALDGFPVYGYQDQGGSGSACTITCGDGVCTDDCNKGNGETCHCGRGYWTGHTFCKTTGDTGVCERAPVTDGCNGHFGPTPDNNGSLTYHYHSRTISPYTVGCFGPSWGRCRSLYIESRWPSCSLECPVANLATGSQLCVAWGYVQDFNVSTVVFGAGLTVPSSTSASDDLFDDDDTSYPVYAEDEVETAFTGTEAPAALKTVSAVCAIAAVICVLAGYWLWHRVQSRGSATSVEYWYKGSQLEGLELASPWL